MPSIHLRQAPIETAMSLLLATICKSTTVFHQLASHSILSRARAHTTSIDSKFTGMAPWLIPATTQHQNALWHIYVIVQNYHPRRKCWCSYQRQGIFSSFDRFEISMSVHIWGKEKIMIIWFFRSLQVFLDKILPGHCITSKSTTPVASSWSNVTRIVEKLYRIVAVVSATKANFQL